MRAAAGACSRASSRWRGCYLSRCFSSSPSSPPSPSSYLQQRLSELSAWQSVYHHPLYNNSFHPSIDLSSFISQYSPALRNGEKDPHQHVIQLCGRVTAKRSSSSKLVFLDLTSEGDTVQIMAEASHYQDDFSLIRKTIRVGDIIGVKGTACRTKTGELSLIPLTVSPLVPCLHEIPEKLTDVEQRVRQRHLDMLCNTDIRHALQTRSTVLRTIRAFLTERRFIEVETPILWSSCGGAAARPFITRSHSLSTDLYLRVAPELFLKQLVIGGMDRVFEVGKVFRNEGIDTVHNPEFTSIELYQAYADYQTLMEMTEDMLRTLVRAVHGGTATRITLTNQPPTQSLVPDTGSVTFSDAAPSSLTIDFSQPFQRIDIMTTLAERLGLEDLPDPNDPQQLSAYIQLAHTHHIPIHTSLTQPISIARILDKMIGALIEPFCIQPTFLLHHPVCMSPLAREHRDSQHMAGLTERWELFIAGREYINAYSELNDSVQQRQRLIEQQRQKQQGDEEACSIDLSYCLSLEYGLPPTAGWGMGVDRLIMLLTNSAHIREVIAFPVYKQEGEQAYNNNSNQPQQQHKQEQQREKEMRSQVIL